MSDSLTICKAIRILHDTLQAMVIKGVALFFFTVASCWPIATADAVEIVPADDDFLKPIGYVTDLARIIEPELERKICNLSAELERKSGARVIVLTMPNLEGYQIESFAEDLLSYWLPDAEVRRNSILLIDALEEEKFRLELGANLDSMLSNQAALRVQEQVLLPSLRAGDKGMAYLLTITELADEIARQKRITLYRLKGPGFLNPQPAVSAPLVRRSLPPAEDPLPPLWFFPIMMVTLWVGYRETRAVARRNLESNNKS